MRDLPKAHNKGLYRLEGHSIFPSQSEKTVYCNADC
jgi:hypothetical protein